MSPESEFHLRIEPDNEGMFGPCSCCGNMTRRVWGYINKDEIPIAAYFVEWTPGHAHHTANVDLIIGKWGEATSALDRKAVALVFRQEPTGPEFMVVDASERPVGTSSLVTEALSREQVIAKPIAATVFALCDCVYARDERIAELRRMASSE